jgi:glucokinase
MTCAIGLDIGGTSVVAAAVRDDGQVLSRADMPTDSQRGIDDGLRRLTGLAAHVSSEAGLSPARIAGIGIGSSKPLDTNAGTITNPYTLPGWDGMPVVAHLEAYFGKPARLLGDCDAAALGEHWVGAGHGAATMLYVTVGTGIGSGIIIENRLFRGLENAAAEFGHTVIDLNGPPCYCGARGCLEMLAAAPAIVGRAQRVFDRSPILRSFCHDDPSQVTARLVYDAAEAGDAAALQVMRDTGAFLGTGIANALNFLGPDKVILGGGVMQGWKHIAPAMFETIYARDAMVPFRRIDILPAALGLNAGVVGAAKAIFDLE